MAGGLGGDTLLPSEENLARGPQWQSLEGMSGESEEDVTQEKDAGEPVADSVMRGEHEGAVRLPDGAVQRGTEEPDRE